MKNSTLHLYGVCASTFDNMLYREALELKLVLVEHVIAFVQLYEPIYRDDQRLNDCIKARQHNRSMLEEKD